MTKDRKHPNYKAPKEAASPASKMITDDVMPGPSMLENFPDYAQLVGCIIAEWSAIELTMTWLVSFSMKEHGLIIQPMVYAVASSRSRLAMMEAALHKIVPVRDGDTTLDEIFSEASDLLDERNGYGHAHYARSASGALVMMKLKHLGTNHPQGAWEPKLDELKNVFHRMKRLKTHVAGLAAMVLGVYDEQVVALPLEPQPTIAPPGDAPYDRTGKTQRPTIQQRKARRPPSPE
jgi:hypothetical protein